MSASSPRRGKRFVLALCTLISCAAILVGASLVWPRNADAAHQETVASESKEKAKASRDYVPGEILVRFRSEAATAKSTMRAEARAELSLESNGRSIPIQVERLDEGREIVEGLRLARVAPEDV